jgi:hypothetical protein
MLFSNNQPKIRKLKMNGKILNLITIQSKQTKMDKKEKDNIYLFTQFYIPENKQRYNEIKETLKYNIENTLITNIILINERKYTEEEMGISDDKIIQIIKGSRMSFIDVFRNIIQMQLNGYIIVSNSDIFFNNTLENIFISQLINKKKVFSLLRIEYDKYNNKKLYEKYDWSADTWIFHTNQSKKIKNMNEFDLTMGIGSVDNILPYKFYKNGFEVFNEPLFIQTLHNHHNDYRTWKKNNLIDNEFFYLSCLPNLRNK